MLAGIYSECCEIIWCVLCEPGLNSTERSHAVNSIMCGWYSFGSDMCSPPNRPPRKGRAGC